MIGVAGELFVGDNADAFGGATGLDARERRRLERAAAVSVRPRVVHGRRWASTASAASRRFTLPRRQNRSAYGSVIFSLTPEVQASFEYRWLRTLAGNVERPNHHFDWVLVHKF